MEWFTRTSQQGCTKNWRLIVAQKNPKNSADALKDAAREIGSRIGEVTAKASRVVEGMKAAVKASAERYKAKPKPKKTKTKSATKKKSSRKSK